MISNFDIDSGLLKASHPERLSQVHNFVKALDLGNVNVSVMHKAAKGERITAPHLIPEIWELEKEFFGLWEPSEIIKQISENIGITKFFKALSKKSILYNSDGKPLSDKEVVELEKILSRALGVSNTKVQEIILRSALVSKMAGKSLMGKPVKINIAELPKTLGIAGKMLTTREVRAIKYAFQFAAESVTSIQSRAKTKIKNTIVRAMSERTHPRTLARQLREQFVDDDKSILERDWERVAVTETNNASNNAYIAGIAPGEYVIGNSHVDACPFCMKYINLKIYKVTDDPPDDPRYMKPGTKKYKEALYRWQTEVWVGKSNVGRSSAKKKRTDTGLVARRPDELTMPTLAFHSHCRCRWSKYEPGLYYIKDGRVEFAVDKESKEEQSKWLADNPDALTGGIPSG